MRPRYLDDPLTFTSCARSGSVFSAFSETSENHLMDFLQSWYDQIHGAERMTPVISLLIESSEMTGTQRRERRGVTRSKEPKVGLYPGPLQRGQSLCTLDWLMGIPAF